MEEVGKAYKKVESTLVATIAQRLEKWEVDGRIEQAVAKAVEARMDRMLKK